MHELVSAAALAALFPPPLNIALNMLPKLGPAVSDSMAPTETEFLPFSMLEFDISTEILN